MKLNLNPNRPLPPAPAVAPTNPALKQIFQRLGAAAAPVQKAA